MNARSSGWLRLIALSLVLWLVAACQSDSDSDASSSRPEVTGTVNAEPSRATASRTPVLSPTDAVDGRSADADVEFVRAIQAQDGTWTFHVTVRHPDTGWEDYADGWDVVTPDGTVLKVAADDHFTRLLLHPHENEQPFTRSQSDIEIPEDVSEVTVRAHDIVDGYGGEVVTVDLTVSQGDNFTVERP
ncbi:MAG: hypothetical protein R3300_06295 [Candidatus Promineifilaceae bacterium]|nr:hypothetical protein [Candidatus Promineifilaceae bacterium]